MLKISRFFNVAEIDQPLFGCFFQPGDFCDQPWPMIAVPVDKFDVGVGLGEHPIIPGRAAAILDPLRPGENGDEMLSVECEV